MAATENALIGLTDEMLDKLRELRRLNVDAAKGFEECADLADNHGIKSAFSEIAHKRREHAQALAAHIEWNEGPEDEEGSYLAAMHRSWIKVREASTSQDGKAIVAEARRGEEHLGEAYAEAIESCAGSPMRETLILQKQVVEKTCDRLVGLCDAKDC